MIKNRLHRSSLFIGDIIGINLVFLFVLFVHFEGSIPNNLLGIYLQCVIVVTISKILIFKYFQLYDSIWEYASIEELIKVVAAVSLSSIVSTIYLISMHLNLFFGLYIIGMIIEVAYIGGIRFTYRFIRRLIQRQSLLQQEVPKSVLIVGSGATAGFIATEIKNHPIAYGKVVGFIDDDPAKHKKNIAGVKVLGNRYDIYSIVARYHVTEIIVAIPTASNDDLKDVLAECKHCNIKVRIMPGVREIIDGQVSMSKIRDVEIEDLLGREQVNLNVSEIAKEIEDHVILVTGGGGSIGSELCRQLAVFAPQKLVILDNYENNAYELQTELMREYPNLTLDVIIASVRDRDNIDRIIREVRPTIIFHAAAHKHVPLMERSPKEAIKNNTFGTLCVAEAAEKYGVDRFVLISTDKAVNPTNVMGASKRLCEMIIQAMSRQSKTKFVAVRFGNVLGSNGSVIPLFKRQILAGGPVTVTHREIVRYFMTIPEAAQLVIQASAIANGGEIFILDMGEPVKIYDLALDLIRLSGLRPHEDIEIKVTGLRPGEKLYEELMMDGEVKETTHKKIYIGEPVEIDLKLLKKSLSQLEQAVSAADNDEFVELLQRIVPTFKNNFIVNEAHENKVASIENYRYKASESSS